MIDPAKARAQIVRCYAAMVVHFLVTFLVLAGALRWMSQLMFAESGSANFWLGSTILISAVLLVLSMYGGAVVYRICDTRSLENAQARLRLVPFLKELARRHRAHPPRVCLLEDKNKDPTAGMLDLLFGEDVLILDDDAIRVLDAEELKAVAAHEWHHKDALGTKGGYSIKILRAALRFLFWIGLMSSGVSWGAFCWAALVYFTAGFVVKYTFAAFERAVETRCDIGAALELNNPEPLISGLQKIQALVREAKPEEWGRYLEKLRVNPFIFSHPATEKRAQLLRALVG